MTASAFDDVKIKELPPPKKVTLEEVVSLDNFNAPKDMDELMKLCDWKMDLDKVRLCFEQQYQRALYAQELATIYKDIKDKLEKEEGGNFEPYGMQPSNPKPVTAPEKTTKKKVVYVKPKPKIHYMGSVSDENETIGFATIDKMSYTFKKGTRIGKYRVVSFDDKCMKLSNRKTYCL
jgi:hypothetical protein